MFRRIINAWGIWWIESKVNRNNIGNCEIKKNFFVMPWWLNIYILNNGLLELTIICLIFDLVRTAFLSSYKIFILVFAIVNGQFFLGLCKMVESSKVLATKKYKIKYWGNKKKCSYKVSICNNVYPQLI